MKKTILLFALILTGLYGFSQNSKYGVRAGVNFSSLNLDTAVPGNIEGRIGFAVGFFGEYNLFDKFKFSPEIQFSAEGAKQQPLRINYVQAPLLFKYIIKEKFALALGPQVGFKGHSFEDQLEDFAISAIGGIEYSISEELFVDARYSFGFTDVFDSVLTTFKGKNRNIQLGVGIKF